MKFVVVVVVILLCGRWGLVSSTGWRAFRKPQSTGRCPTCSFRYGGGVSMENASTRRWSGRQKGMTSVHCRTDNHDNDDNDDGERPFDPSSRKTHHPALRCVALRCVALIRYVTSMQEGFIVGVLQFFTDCENTDNRHATRNESNGRWFSFLVMEDEMMVMMDGCVVVRHSVCMRGTG